MAISSVLGSYLERFGSDRCSELAINEFGGVSNCDIQSELCLKMFWLNSAKETFVYSNVPPEPSSSPLSCSEAESWSRSLLGKRKMDSEAAAGESPSFLRTPIWYSPDVSCVENIENGVESILDAFGASLTPFVRRWPLGDLSRNVGAAVKSIIADVEFIAGLISDEGLNGRVILRGMRKTLKSDRRFEEFELYTRSWITDWSPARFDQGNLLRRLAPFVNIYASLIQPIEQRKWARPGVLFSELLTKFPTLAYIPLFYRPVHAGILPGAIESLLSKLVPRARALWVFIRHRHFGDIMVNVEEDTKLLSRLEELVSHAMLSRGGPPHVLETSNLMCASDVLSPVVGFVSWFWSKKEQRRAERLIFSLVEICKDSSLVTDRGSLMNFLPTLMRERYPVFFKFSVIQVNSDRISLVLESRRILETDYEFVQRDFVVKFTDTLAQGDVGPRAQWLSIMIEEYFQPGTGLFEIADNDENRNYLKPVARVACSDCMLAAGRLIGIGIRYGISIGAKLTPCSLALLRMPSGAFDDESHRIEACVSAEDPSFVAGIEKAREFFTWEDKQAAQTLLIEITEGETDSIVTREFFEAFVKRKLYEKGIQSVRHSVMLLKDGINSVLPQGTVELFTRAEFEKMVYGVDRLSADTLWAGITMGRVPEGYPIAEWLKELLEETDEDAFRFAFNRFVTGNLQPPIRTDEPWIRLDVEPLLPTNSLPIARTCFSILQIPQYTDKDTFHQKLRYAVLEGTATIDLE